MVCVKRADQVRRGGPGGGASDNARTLQAALGLPIRVIDGYKGTADIRLAAESGELAGACFAWESFKTTWRKGLESGDFNVIVQAMPQKHPELPNVPLANDYVKTEEGRRLLKHGVYDTAIITRPYFLAPGTPKSRVQLLRRAFADTLKDPELLAEAKKASLDIQYVSGEETEASRSGAVQNRARVYREDEAGSGSVAANLFLYFSYTDYRCNYFGQVI